MKLRVSITVEHLTAGKTTYFQEMEIYDDTNAAGFMYMCARLASYVAVKLVSAFESALRNGSFRDEIVDVDVKFPPNSKRNKKDKI